MTLVLTSFPDAKIAKKLASALVDKKLAACASVLPGVWSTYCWKGQVEKVREALLLIKTTKAKWGAVQKFVLSRHPCELPELIALPVTLGSKKYLSWVEKSIQ